LIERSGRAVEISGRVVILTEPRRGIAVFFQDLTDGGAVFTYDGIIAGEAGGHFSDHAEADRVMVSTRNEGRARRRAKRSGMKLSVSRAIISGAVNDRCRNDNVESAVD